MCWLASSRMYRDAVNVVAWAGPTSLRAELGLTPTAPVIGAVGALRAGRRLDVVLLAAARLRAEFPELTTVIVGEGPERPCLEALAADHGLGEQVRFLGRRHDALELAAGFDVALLTSERQGYPLVLL